MHMNTKVWKHTRALETPRLLASFSWLEFVEVSDGYLATCNLGNNQANKRSNKCNEEEKIAWDYTDITNWILKKIDLSKLSPGAAFNFLKSEKGLRCPDAFLFSLALLLTQKSIASSSRLCPAILLCC